MYNATQTVVDAINGDSRTFYLKIEVDGKTITEGIKTLKQTSSSSADSGLMFGGAVAGMIDVTLEHPGYTIENRELNVLIGVKTTEGVEYVPVGLYTVAKPEIKGNLLSFTAYDRMMKLEKAYFSDLVYPTTAKKIVTEIGTMCGVSVDLTNVPDVTISVKPDGYTCREMVSYIAQLGGCFANINRVGILVFNWYSAGVEFGTNRCDEPTWGSDMDYTLSKIEVAVNEEATISVGSGAVSMQFSNPFMTQDALNNIWTNRQGFAYRGGNVNIRLGNVLLDPWDIITVGGISIPCMEIVHTYDGGVSTTVTAKQESSTDSEINYKGPTATAIDRQYAELILVKEVLAEKVSTDELEVVTANIDKANMDLANIETLLAGHVGTGTLQAIHMTAQNSVIDDAVIESAMIVSLDFGKLTGIDIDTTHLTIHSNDGRSLWSDNTIQISDANHVRVQIGKDANGDYSMYVWDANGDLMFDALGLTADGIQREIIRNDMVSETANISGSKLDIKSVIENINNDGSTSLNTSKIKFDETGQSLDVAFDSLTNKVDVNTNAVVNLNTQMSIVNGKIESKVWQTDINSAMDDIKIGGRNLIRNSKNLIFDKYKFG